MMLSKHYILLASSGTSHRPNSRRSHSGIGRFINIHLNVGTQVRYDRGDKSCHGRALLMMIPRVVFLAVARVHSSQGLMTSWKFARLFAIAFALGTRRIDFAAIFVYIGPYKGVQAFQERVQDIVAMFLVRIVQGLVDATQHDCIRPMQVFENDFPHDCLTVDKDKTLKERDLIVGRFHLGGFLFRLVVLCGRGRRALHDFVSPVWYGTRTRKDLDQMYERE